MNVPSKLILASCLVIKIKMNILWLAGFIERMTTGGETHLPPISKFIPPDFKFNCEFDNAKTPAKSTHPDDEGELIINYFKSEAFMKIINEEK